METKRDQEENKKIYAAAQDLVATADQAYYRKSLDTAAFAKAFIRASIFAAGLEETASVASSELSRQCRESARTYPSAARRKMDFSRQMRNENQRIYQMAKDLVAMADSIYARKSLDSIGVAKAFIRASIFAAGLEETTSIANSQLSLKAEDG